MAVETASAVTNQELKAGKGEEEWKQLFRLLGGIIAIYEISPLPPSVPISFGELRHEASALIRKLNVVRLLEGMSEILVTPIEASDDDAFYLLILDSQKKQLINHGFMKDQFAQASLAYTLAERKFESNPEVQVLLAAADNIKELRKAYPSYFLDSTNFLAIVRELVEYR